MTKIRCNSCSDRHLLSDNFGTEQPAGSNGAFATTGGPEPGPNNQTVVIPITTKQVFTDINSKFVNGNFQTSNPMDVYKPQEQKPEDDINKAQNDTRDPDEFVGSDDEEGMIFGLPANYVYIGGGVLGLLILGTIIYNINN